MTDPLVLSNVASFADPPSGVLEIDGSVNLVGPAPQYLINGVPIGGGGGGVASLNGLQGALNLLAGSNVTITPSGQNITISASGGGGTPAGNPGDIQFNNYPSFGGEDRLFWDVSLGMLLVTGSINISGQFLINGVPIGGGGQAQTPWAQNVDAASHSLSNVLALGVRMAPRAGYALDVTGICSFGGGYVTIAGAGGNVLSVSGGNVNVDTMTGNAITAAVSATVGGAALTTATRINWITNSTTWKIEASGSATATPGELAIVNGGYINISLRGSGQNPTIALPWLRTTAPAAGSKELWCDTANGNVVKFGV